MALSRSSRSNISLSVDRITCRWLEEEARLASADATKTLGFPYDVSIGQLIDKLARELDKKETGGAWMAYLTAWEDWRWRSADRAAEKEPNYEAFKKARRHVAGRSKRSTLKGSADNG